MRRFALKDPASVGSALPPDVGRGFAARESALCFGAVPHVWASPLDNFQGLSPYRGHSPISNLTPRRGIAGAGHPVAKPNVPNVWLQRKARMKLNPTSVLTTLPLLLAMVSVFTPSFAAHSQERGGRIAPPPALKCDRSDLTLYDGKVLAYRRRKGSTLLRVRTSFDTTEVVTLHHRGTADPSAFFLLNGERFTQSDWGTIEKRKGVLKTEMRANIWVCRGNPAIQPVVDWRPPGGRGQKAGGMRLTAETRATQKVSDTDKHSCRQWREKLK